MLLQNEIAVDWLSVAMCFGTYSFLGARMRTRGLVRPLFVAKTTLLGIPNFCSAEKEWVGNGVKDDEVRDSNDVQVGLKLVDASVKSIRSPLSKGMCQLGGAGWLGLGRMLVIKVSAVTIDGVRCKQNVGMLVWLGGNVLG